MPVILILLNIANRITNITLFTCWKKFKEKIPYMTTLCSMLSSQISIRGKFLACRFQFCYTQVWTSMETVCPAPQCRRVTFPARFFSVHNLLAFCSWNSARYSRSLKVTLLKTLQFHARFVTITGKHQFPH